MAGNGRQRPWGAIAVVFILIAAGIWLALHLRWEEETTRSGFTGDALRNPYHAGMLLLAQSGYPAQRIDNAMALDGMAPRSTLLLNSPELFNNRKQAAKLLAWIKSGGHLVLPLARNSDPDTLLQAIGIQLLGWNETSARQQTVAVERSMMIVDLEDAVVFDIETGPDWEARLVGYFDQKPFDQSANDEDDEQAETDAAEKTVPMQPFKSGNLAKIPQDRLEHHSVYARWQLGNGYVTAGDFLPFRNSDIDRHDHAPLFVRLMSLPGDARPVYIALSAEYPGLGSWLIEHAGEALVALMILLAAILWRAMPRFGPLLPNAVPRRPGLLEHLGAVGDFLLRQKQYEALIAPLREDVIMQLTHLRGRHPEIASLPELGAHIAGLDVREVTLALTPEPADAHEFQRRSRTLATLRQYCNTFSREGTQP